jgi:hypothetical protein
VRVVVGPADAQDQTASHRRVISRQSRSSAWARWMILSSMSVMFDT